MSRSRYLVFSVVVALGVAQSDAPIINAQAGSVSLTLAFSESSGTQAADGSGNGNHAALINGPAWTSNGRFGNGLGFDGVNDRVEIPSSETLHLSTAFTFEAWVRPTVDQWHTIWTKGPTSGTYTFWLKPGLVPVFEAWLSNGYKEVTAPNGLSLGAWSHLAVTYDGALLRLFVNGTEVDSEAATGTLPMSEAPLQMGNRGPGGDPFAGVMDEIRVYGVALSASEVAVDMVTPLDESTPFQVVSPTPLPGAVGVLTTPITARFSRPTDEATVSDSTFELRDPAGAMVPATVSFDAATRTATLAPAEPLAAFTDYSARILGGASGVKDSMGNALGTDTQWVFRTAAAATLPSAAYAFSEASGTTAADSSGNGNAAALIHGTSHTSAWSGNGLAFDGINDRVEIPSSETLQLSTAFTFEAWVQPAIDQWHTVWTKGPTGGTYTLWLMPGVVPMFQAWLSNGYKELTAPSGLPLSAWSHLAVTYDGTTLRLFVNGNEVATSAATGLLPVSNAPLQLGNRGPGGDPFNGVMDEVRVYRRALSGAEIVDDMNTPVDDTTPPTVTSTSPLSGAVDVNPGGNITASFSEALSPGAVTSTTFALRDPGGNIIPAAVTYDSTTQTATLDPTSRLANLTTYTATLRGGAVEPQIEDLPGNALATDYVWTFTTADAETTPPTILADVRPKANAGGWHNSPVTVTFSCNDASGIASCQAPITVSQSGADQLVTGTAVDSFGNHATANVIVDVDKTSGHVVIDPPVDGATTTDSSIVLIGHVSDLLSGIVSAKCNGTSAPVSAGVVQCTVPLLPGLNELTLQAFDAAGNSASAGVRVTRSAAATQLVVSPGSRTLLVGESAVLTVRSEHGLVPEGITWSSSDPAIASVTAEGVVTAVAAGDATVTATNGTLSAAATITVLATSTLAAGTSRWQLPPTPGLTMQAPIYANRVDDDGPDLFTVETGAEGVLPIVRALRADGTTLWTQTAPGTPVFGDSFGGLTAALYADPTDELAGLDFDVGFLDGLGDERRAMRALARFGGPPTAPPWRYQSPGFLQGGAAQAPDGTIYAVERVTTPWPLNFETSILAIDGSSGAVTLRIPIEEKSLDGVDCYWGASGCVNSRDEAPPLVSAPAIGADGSAYFQVERSRGNYVGIQREDHSWDLSGSTDVSLWMLKISPAGSQSWIPLCEYHSSVPLGVGPWYFFPEVTLPESNGGVLAKWAGGFCGPSTFFNDHITRIDSNGATSTLDAQVWDNYQPRKLSMIGDGTAYITHNGTITAKDIPAWTTRWTSNTTSIPVMAVADGGLLVHDSATGTLTEVNSEGSSSALGSLQLSAPASALQFGRWEGLTAGALSSVVGHEAHPAVFSFVADGGSSQRNYAPRTAHKTIDRAAITALQFYNPGSIEANREHGGSICKANGEYFANIPNIAAGFSDEVIPTGCGVGVRVGDYHTHARVGNDGFSSHDIDRANLDHNAGVYVQYFVATPCGNIDKYVGPNYSVYLRLPEKTRTSRVCNP